MPQFCLLFSAILQSWRPKGGGGAWHNAPLPKYAPDWTSLTEFDLRSQNSDLSTLALEIY